MTREQNTSQRGNRAGSANTNGHNGHHGDADDQADINGRQPGDEGYNPFDTLSTNQKHRERREAEHAAQAVTEKRQKQFGKLRFDAAVLDGMSAGWARKQAEKIAKEESRTNPLKAEPKLMFSGADAVNVGATDAQIKALTPLSPDEIKALTLRAAAMLEDQKNQVREMARQLAAERAAAGYADISTRVDLSTYTPPDDPFIVDNLIPLGKSMGLFSERKAGKTTANVDLLRALLTGGKFLGKFATLLAADADVVFLDTEMGADMMQYELSAAGVSDPALLRRINYHDLLGRSAMLNMRDDATRAYWRDQIRPGSFIILDCLYTVLSALNVDESSSQVADVIEGFKTLAVECGAVGRVITHHLGKDPDKGARGHSSIEGAVDTLATIRLDGPPAADTPRTFEAFGRRGVNVPPGLLALKPTDDGRRGLTMSGNTVSADRAKAADHKNDDIVWKLINDHPGKSVRALQDLPTETRHNVSRDRLRRSVERLGLLGYVVNKGTDTRPEWYAADRTGDPLTDPEPLAAECVDRANPTD
ncbi:hypothetical protein BST11_21060 [Mycobacterium alsense]|uniref:AAA family ATPase n=1 Tax=Mycobacterium alsense TaxID=324058 RepID=A0AA42BXB8_9MYCO|nr:AAA family ATPase [Mycobacterium alsense]MCV7377949.1 AAA family ATPase [Mycobacterium alsense]OQZ88815.1 hypothetical protein BST11_21060 [Mycobacterium alsense]